MKADFLKILCCPATGTEFKLQSDKLITNEQVYPLIQGIPWLFNDPEKNFFTWAGKIQQFFKEEKTYINYLQNLETLSSPKSTKKRLAQIKEAKTKNLKAMQATLSDFHMDQELKGEISSQQIHSYFDLIFRDWSSDDNEELNTYCQYLEQNLNPNSKNILILGCGASGLNYHLANKFPEKNFIGLDHNPFLLLTAKKLFQGHEIKLSDYQNFASGEEFSKLHKMKSAEFKGDNHLFILSSFPHLPIQTKSIDTIIAPWFFDIIDFNFEQAVKYSTQYLKDDGQLLLFGPSNLHKTSVLEQWGINEFDECLDALFDESESHTSQVPYLKNDLASQNRLECLYFFNGKSPKRFDSYHIEQNELKIHFNPAFEKYKAVNETYFHILKHIKEDISADDLALKIHEEFGFSPEESLYYADNFIYKLNFELK